MMTRMLSGISAAFKYISSSCASWWRGTRSGFQLSARPSPSPADTDHSSTSFNDLPLQLQQNILVSAGSKAGGFVCSSRSVHRVWRRALEDPTLAARVLVNKYGRDEAALHIYDYTAVYDAIDSPFEASPAVAAVCSPLLRVLLRGLRPSRHGAVALSLVRALAAAGALDLHRDGGVSVAMAAYRTQQDEATWIAVFTAAQKAPAVAISGGAAYCGHGEVVAKVVAEGLAALRASGSPTAPNSGDGDDGEWLLDHLLHVTLVAASGGRSKQHEAIVARLLEAGADPEEGDGRALKRALALGTPRNVRLILGAGADTRQLVGTVQPWGGNVAKRYLSAIAGTCGSVEAAAWEVSGIWLGNTMASFLHLGIFYIALLAVQYVFPGFLSDIWAIGAVSVVMGLATGFLICAVDVVAFCLMVVLGSAIGAALDVLAGLPYHLRYIQAVFVLAVLCGTVLRWRLGVPPLILQLLLWLRAP